MYRLAATALASLVLGCATSRGDAPSPKVASADDIAITLEELDDWVKEQLFRERTDDRDPARVYDVRIRSLDPLIEQRVIEREARRRDVSVEELLASAREEIGDGEIQAFYAEHREQFGKQGLEELAPRIRNHLQLRSQRQAIDAWVRAADVAILLEPPRFDVAETGPSRGPDDAVVTIVEFSDFQCPFCRRALPTLQQVLERYPDDVRLVYRHFPLDSIHPRARPAAEAAVCLEEQGLFWEFHDALLAGRRPLADGDLRQLALQVGADPVAYDACVASEATASRVESDVAAARAAGVGATPAFFVNGILISGAQPFSAFERVIERERGLAAAAP